MISPFHSRHFGWACKTDRWSCVDLGTNISLEPDECCRRHRLCPGLGKCPISSMIWWDDLLITWDPPHHSLWAQSSHKSLSGLSLLPLWAHLCSSLPPRSGTWGHQAPWMEDFCFLNINTSTYLSCLDRVPILWAGSSAPTTTSTDIVASPLFHSPRPKMTSCLGSGRGTWAWKHFRLDLLRMRHVWAVALEKKAAFESAFLPDELTRGLAQGPEHVKAPLPHVVFWPGTTRTARGAQLQAQSPVIG